MEHLEADCLANINRTSLLFAIDEVERKPNFAKLHSAKGLVQFQLFEKRTRAN